jgi:cell division protein FtsB
MAQQQKEKLYNLLAKNEQLEDKIKELENELSQKKVYIANLKRQILKIMHKSESKDIVIHSLKETNKELEATIREKESTIKDLKDSVLNLELLYSKAQKSLKKLNPNKER